MILSNQGFSVQTDNTKIVCFFQQEDELKRKVVNNTVETTADTGALQRLEAELATVRRQLSKQEAESREAELRAVAAERQLVLSREKSLEQKLMVSRDGEEG